MARDCGPVGGIAVLLLCAASACAGPDRDALRRIVQDQCLPHWRSQRAAAPCLRVVVPDPPHQREGYAVLADRKGGAHFLLIPTATIAGVESPELRDPAAPNFFEDAWRARALLAVRIGHGVDRAATGLALNPRHARSQDQLHIHIECLRPDFAASLGAAARDIGGTWAPVEVGGSRYLAIRAAGEELRDNPIASLAAQRPETAADMADYSFVVAGMRFAGAPGFIVLAGNGPAGELSLDPTCALATLK
ncbi:MAG TPA: CDP-diacylglycerol diphosphatase [Steroidobacteraceae bacterium]|jgi:CDP-diacylglycerol pyrophosphatase|nr:CDP-diacylglycerol diphosphatase [Steroidobacteraceae bacterium]